MARRSVKSPQLKITMATPAPRTSASDTVYESLREAILSRDLPGGTPLIEAQLAEEFQISKTPIREALQRLAHSGLVDYELARGATVHTLTQSEIHDIVEMRLTLETLALRQSAPHLTDDDTRTLNETLATARDALNAGDYQRMSQLNTQFHSGLYSRATNHLLVKWLDSLNDRRRLITMHGWAFENRSLREWDEHRSILDAVCEGDVPLAAQRLEDHIRRFAELVLVEDALTNTSSQSSL